MAVKQKFQWSWPHGVTPVHFEQWIETLPEVEKQECLAGISNQLKFRQEAIDRGDMILGDSEYIWKDEETASKGKGIDEVWERYWRRWQAETQAILTVTYEDK